MAKRTILRGRFSTYCTDPSSVWSTWKPGQPHQLHSRFHGCPASPICLCAISFESKFFRPYIIFTFGPLLFSPFALCRSCLWSSVIIFFGPLSFSHLALCHFQLWPSVIFTFSPLSFSPLALCHSHHWRSVILTFGPLSF